MLIIVCRLIVCRTILYVSVKKQVLIDFGNSVRSRRMALGISQEEFAERVGLHRTYIGMIERAEKNITLENIEKIAKGLGVPIADLFSEVISNYGQK